MGGASHTHLDCVLEEPVEHVGPVPHVAYVRGTGVPALAVGDGADKLVGELLGGAKQTGLHKVHHGVV